MKIAILGGSGYIGTNLIASLLEAPGSYELVSISAHATTAAFDSPRLSKVNFNILKDSNLADILEGCEVVFYLLHMMAQKDLDFVEAERISAEKFVQAAKVAKVRRVIYLGGLGNDNDALSRHLLSRHHTGEILRASLPEVIEFRASMVIGDGSISYDIIKSLVHKLPVLTIPRWAKTLTQPIGLGDAITYLMAAIKVPISKSEIVEIGGPEKISYKELMQRYAKWDKKKVILIYLPFIPLGISGWWLNLFTPKKHAKVGRTMVESLENPMIVTNNRAAELFPEIKPLPLEDSFV
jgi:uncharacterized protein YbjT (DUF2867 family)